MPRPVLALGGRALGAAALVTALVLGAPHPSSAAIRPPDPVLRYADALQEVNGRLGPAARYELAQRFLLLASYYRIDPALLMAIVTVESSWHAHAVSPVGALGFGQLMPGTAAGLNVDPLEPYENLDGTARYLRRLLNHYAGRNDEQRIRLAVASYNAGPGAIDRYGGVPPYRETQAYVVNVLRWRGVYSALAGPARLDVAHVLAGAIPSRPQLVARRRTTRPVLARTAPAAAPTPATIAFVAPPPDPHPYHRATFGDLPPDPYETAVPAHRKRGLFAHLFARR